MAWTCSTAVSRGAALVAVGIGLAQRDRLLQRHAHRDVAVQHVVGGRLVGDEVEVHAAAGQLGEHLAGVSEQADRQADALVGGLADAGDGVVEVGGHLVQVAGLEPAGDAVRVDLDVEAGGTGERRGQRLGAAHAAQAGGEDGAAGQVGRAPVLLTGGGERLEGALQDALGADVDPRAGGHLAEHGQALGLEPAELVPGGEARHQQRVGDQHPRGARVGAEDGDRLAALDEHASRRSRARAACARWPGARRGCGRRGRSRRRRSGGSGSSATSGSRLLQSMRRAASWCQPLQRRSVPRGACTLERSPTSASTSPVSSFVATGAGYTTGERARHGPSGRERAQSPTRPPSPFRGNAGTDVTAAVTGESHG